jgi:hypothetical protein
MAIVAAVIVAAVAAAAAGYSAYQQSEAQAYQAKQQKKMAQWQQQVEEWNADLADKEAEAARKQARLKSSRLLNAQAARAGRAGVVDGEGSLLVSQMEAASMAQYEEDLAAFGKKMEAKGHRINATTSGFEASLFKGQEKYIRRNQALNVTVATVGSLASSYGSYSGGGSSSGTKARATSPSPSGYQSA